MLQQTEPPGHRSSSFSYPFPNYITQNNILIDLHHPGTQQENAALITFGFISLPGHIIHTSLPHFPRKKHVKLKLPLRIYRLGVYLPNKGFEVTEGQTRVEDPQGQTFFWVLFSAVWKSIWHIIGSQEIVGE